MTWFIALSAVLIAAALALLLPPLVARHGARAGRRLASNRAVYADQLAELAAEHRAGAITGEQLAAARAEIERRALDEAPDGESAAPASSSGLTAIAIGIAVPLVAIALYAFLGNPQALFSGPGAASSPHAVTPEQIEAMAKKLAARLEANPGDTEGWIMLGRSYGALGRFQDAAAAYAKAAAQRPADAQLLADYADALAMAHGRNLLGEPEALIARAVAADGSNVKALALAGSVAFERSDYQAAIAYWRRIAPLVGEDSEFAQSIRSGIAEAESQLGPSPAPKAPARITKSDAPRREAALLQGNVSLAPAAAGKARPEDSVFIFARAAQGPRMPLAALRRQVKDLPLEFSLDDSMAMNPALRLSDFAKVVVVARISRSGSPTPQKGDLEAATAPMAPRTKGIRLEIVRAVE